MTAKQVYQGTMPFSVAKLALGAVTIVLSAVLFAILMGIGWLFGGGGTGIAIVLWVGGTGVIRFVIMHYMGYLVKAGHVAVIAEAITTGKIPANQVGYGKKIVADRFATSNIYFAVDKLVTGAVKQIQRGIGKAGNALDFIPGMGAITGLAKFFVDISLGYIDECCLGYTFYKKEQGAFKSAADGVVIYAQNWKTLLKNAAKTMAKVVALLTLIVLAVFIPVGLLFKLLHWSPLVAFLLACLIAWVVKFAFVDSYILCQMMTSYIEVAPTTQITFDLYSKLSELSYRFKELFNKGQQEQLTPAYAASTTSGTTSTISAQPTSQSARKSIFCGQCGAKNESGIRFCDSCGTKIE